MVLAVDIGNSNVVISCFEGDDIRRLERMSTNRNSTALEYAVLIKTVLELNGLDKVAFEGGIISSVVPAVTNMVKAAIEKLTGKPPLVVGPGLKTGLKIMIDNPAQLGSDRVADAVAAVSEYPCPLITIDMGTATTISVIDKNQNFIGGVIMPGLRISAESLSSRTSQLPQISLDPPKKAIGRNTIDCMRSGIVLGCAATIDGIVEKIEQELGYPCTVVSTGGHANIVIPYCKRQIIVDEKLLLKGLMILYRKNA
jgi:type III pantothenate kinase